MALHSLLLLFPVQQVAGSGGVSALPATVRGAIDVPLSLRRGGLVLLLPQRGVSFFDYDADGWIDLYLSLSGQVFHNLNGHGFALVADLDPLIPVRPGSTRYGAACGDYDNDGFPDIASEPRNGCFYLLKNLDGTTGFREVASDPSIVIDRPPCTMLGETFCWADVDEDGDLDLFAPAYPDSFVVGSGGNRFFENLGPSGPGGAYRLALRTPESGLENPPGVARPEGAQFTDADRDGDLDLYSNGTLYQNVTGTDGPRFRPLVGAPTGLSLFSRLDEGALFFDPDMDGDQDLFVLHFADACRFYENRGDCTFRDRAAMIEQPVLGSVLGCSAEDWDLDGDLDLTAGNVFRRNLLIESGEPFLRVASHTISPVLTSWLAVTPAWGDMDRDGDLDCAWANNGAYGALLWNETYTSETPALERLSLRVRPVHASKHFPRGLETEFGATVELRVHDDVAGRVRRRFTASSHGYLQQSEYALTFGLPSGPDPGAPARGVRFDLLVDFPSRSERGILRVDRTVNPLLGALELSALLEREITVFRSGVVLLDGVLFPPSTRFTHRLATTGRLSLPDPSGPLAEPVSTLEPAWSVGLELGTLLAPGAVRIEELVLDGQLAPPGSTRCDSNVVMWDVTPGASPRLVRAERLATSSRNHRSFLPLSWKLEPGRVYRVLCRVTELRASPSVAPLGGAVSVAGAFSLATPNPCDLAVVLAAPLFPDRAFFELRYRTETGATAR